MERGSESGGAIAGTSSANVASPQASRVIGSAIRIWVQQQMQLSSPVELELSEGKPKLSHRSGAIISQANSSAPVTSSKKIAAKRNRTRNRRFTILA